MDFYANYVRLCSAKGVSPSAGAIAVGLDKSAASRWARGSAPRYQTLARMSEYFGVPVSEIIGLTNDNAEELAKAIGVSSDVLRGPKAEETTHIENAPKTETEKQATPSNNGGGLEAALEALRNQPGRRALLSATKNMTEAQVLRFADWLADITGSDKD